MVVFYLYINVLYVLYFLLNNIKLIKMHHCGAFFTNKVQKQAQKQNYIVDKGIAIMPPLFICFVYRVAQCLLF